MLTLQELKQIVDVPYPGMKIPTAKKLKEYGTVIAKKSMGCETEILAFQNGYALYQVSRFTTVFPICFCGEYQYNAEQADCISEEFFNQTIFEITKSDLTTGEELPGAKLEVTDQDGTVVDEWTSGTEPHIIKELEVGKEYTLTETLPADGYVTAESITFTVENTAEVQKVEMKDDVTKVEISKTDISGKELPGAKMTVLDKDGNAVESWTSTDKPHYMEKLPIGDYILREETAPEGYLIAEDVEFSVKDTGEIQKVSMKDEKKPSETPQTPQEPSKPTDTPKTGDDSNIRLWLLLAGLALCGTGGSLFLLKKKK